jgi:hypothetical protein
MDLMEIRWKDVDWIHLAQDSDELRGIVKPETTGTLLNG